jgi:4-hydroxybenzoyl-CoA reductase subunit alpha
MSNQKDQFDVVGKSVPKYDAFDKVRGIAQFTDDIELPRMIYGKIKPSTVAHGRIKRIDCQKALEIPGVLAVITGEECPKAFSVNNYFPTEYPLAYEKVCYHGEGVAAVAALDEETAERALEAIEVEYEKLPHVLDPLEAMQRDDVRIHDFAENNISYAGEQTFGDVEESFRNSHVVVENNFYSSYVHPGYIEPQSAIADYNPGTERLTVYTCIQLPHYYQLMLARTLEMPAEKIRVIVPYIGGAFGGKTEGTPASLAACILSRKLGRPVKITYDREEVFFQNKGRHPAHVRMRMGFDKEGRITAVDFDNTLEGGAHSSWGFVVLWFTAALTHLPYKLPNVHFNGRRVYTNKPTTGAQRCLGGIQVRIPIESLIDEGAKALGMSPLDVRMKNAVETGHQTASIIKVPHSEFKKCLEDVARRSGFAEKYGRLPFGKGIGMAGGHYSTGGAFLLYASLRPHSTANIRVDTEACVTVFTGATDLGQGATTVLRQMTAEVLGVDYRDVNLVCQDTMLAPMDNGTYDSRLTYGGGHAVKNAAMDSKKKLMEATAALLKVNQEHLECRDGTIYSIYNPKKQIPFYEAVSNYQNAIGPLFGTGSYTPPQPKASYPGGLIGPTPTFGFTAQVAEVEVDTETGQIDVVGYYESTDCGKAINPASVEGQIHGGISMGLGQALYEEMLLDEEGRMLNPDLNNYKMPTPMDMPEISANIVDSYDPSSSFGNKEIGEGPTGPVVPAIMNAIYDAIGIRFTGSPVTPEKILKALNKR